MQIKEKRWQQFIPRALDEVWDFFSRPENLNEITPKEMSFEILSDIACRSMYEGMIIRYHIRPILNIPMNWVTEITHIRNHEYFIDVQRSGPYAFWHHQHFFTAVEGGTRMQDILHYKVPLGLLGNLADILFVDQKIETIFNFRFKEIERRFGPFTPLPASAQ